ncbi:hypothetical protein BpHYR1_015244 [Brachionus plicatilis]|uniref:Uncharacterized protein n=1 Tax=Brachionus plicatilis TaxID=10195 RepID=A0A3M7Q4U6_BRAPC|nr:hypothetical protein BpHYR1_015244 [Brachionus plicatilis]
MRLNSDAFIVNNFILICIHSHLIIKIQLDRLMKKNSLDVAQCVTGRISRIYNQFCGFVDFTKADRTLLGTFDNQKWCKGVMTGDDDERQTLL